MEPTTSAPGTGSPVPRTFIQSARGMSWHGGALTLLGLSPATVVVSAGDGSFVGHVSTGDFLDSWKRVGDDRHGTEAVLSLLDAGARHAGDATLRLRRPTISRDGLRYDAELTRGTLPPSSGACVLYVSPACSPSTPPSQHGERDAAFPALR